jgi:hypothetical protein
MDNSQRNNRNSSNIPWFAVIIGFIVFWPVGLGLLIFKLGQEGQSDESKQKWSDTLEDFKDDMGVIKDNFKEDFQREFQQSRERMKQGNYTYTTTTTYQANYRSTDGKNVTQQKRTQRQTKKQGKPVKIKNGKLSSIVGICMALGFSLGFIDEMTIWLPNYPMMALQEAFVPFLFAGIGAGLFVWGQFKNRQAHKFRKLLNLIGSNKYIDIRTLSEAMPCDYNRACDMLQSMIDQGYLGEKAYIDMSTGYLVLDGRGLENRPRPKPQPQPKSEPVSNTDSDQAILEEIRRVNQSIPDPVLTRKINRIEDITGHILEYQKKHPERAAELHKFLNYYLPTTLKILNSYAELDRQGVEGENINATKERIEGMMDLVVEGFEKQLDKLFEGDMMDISADISVMEKMLNHDGLAGGMKMPKTEKNAKSEPAPKEDEGIHLTLDPEGDSATAQAPEWEDSFYRRTKEELEG